MYLVSDMFRFYLTKIGCRLRHKQERFLWEVKPTPLLCQKLNNLVELKNISLSLPPTISCHNLFPTCLNPINFGLCPSDSILSIMDLEVNCNNFVTQLLNYWFLCFSAFIFIINENSRVIFPDFLIKTTGTSFEITKRIQISWKIWLLR